MDRLVPADLKPTLRTPGPEAGTATGARNATRAPLPAPGGDHPIRDVGSRVSGGGPGECRGRVFAKDPRLSQFVPTEPEAEAETDTETLIDASMCAIAATAPEIWPLMHSA